MSEVHNRLKSALVHGTKPWGGSRVVVSIGRTRPGVGREALRLRVGRRNAGLSHQSVGKLDAGRTPEASDVEDANDAK